MSDAPSKTVYEKISVYKPIALSTLPKPNQIYDAQVIKTIKDKIALIENQNREILQTHAQKPFFYIKKTLVFHQDATVGVGVARQLNQFGFCDVASATGISEAFSLLRSQMFECLFVHYDGDAEEPIDLIREINETRDLRPLYIIVICPGETSLKKFSIAGPDLIVDTTMLPEKNKALFQKKIRAIFDSWQTKTEHSSMVQLRSKFRAAKFGVAEDGFSEEVQGGLMSVFENAPEKKRWKLAEGTLQAILAGDKDKAGELGARLLFQFPLSLDARLIYGLQLAVAEGIENAAKWLFRHTENHRDLNLEKAFVIGSVLAKWKILEPLEQFVLLWHEREDLVKDHQFHFILSKYFELKGDGAKAALHLRSALSEAPLRTEYVLAYAELLAKSGNQKAAADILEGFAKINKIEEKYIRQKLSNLTAKPRDKAS